MTGEVAEAILFNELEDIEDEFLELAQNHINNGVPPGIIIGMLETLKIEIIMATNQGETVH